MKSPNRLEALQVAGAEALDAAGKALDPNRFLMYAALALGACGNDQKISDEGALDDTATGASIADTDTDADSDSDADADTDTDTDADTDADTDVTPTVGDTTMSQADCKKHLRKSPTNPDNIASDIIVGSLGHDAEYLDGTTVHDELYDPSVEDQNVFGCLYNGLGQVATETRVTRVPATDAYPMTLTVEGEIELKGGIVVLQLLNAEKKYIPHAEGETNTAWTFGAEAGSLSDMER